MKIVAAVLAPFVFIASVFAAALFIGVLLLVKHYEEWRNPGARP